MGRMVVSGTIMWRSIFRFVRRERQAKLPGDRRHGLNGYRQRQHRHHKQAHAGQRSLPGSKNVLGCGFRFAKYHRLTLFGWVGSRPENSRRNNLHL